MLDIKWSNNPSAKLQIVCVKRLPYMNVFEINQEN